MTGGALCAALRLTLHIKFFEIVVFPLRDFIIENLIHEISELIETRLMTA